MIKNVIKNESDIDKDLTIVFQKQTLIFCFSAIMRLKSLNFLVAMGS